MEPKSPNLNVESFDDPEHEFALRWSAKQAGGVIAALTAKSIVEVTPQTASVSFIDMYDTCHLS